MEKKNKVNFIVEPKTQSEVEDNEESIRVLSECLQKDDRALSYLYSRGLEPETVKEFNLGYLPSSGSISFTNSSLQKVLQGRVVIPVFNNYGDPICLVGRAITDSKLKYWHPSYNKTQTLWNIHKAKPHILNKKYCIIVEGFMHVMSLHGKGVRNVVSLQGTSLQYERAALIGRYTTNVVYITDNDEPGNKSWSKVSKMLKEEPFNYTIKKVHVPEGYNDVDDFILNGDKSDVIDMCRKLIKEWDTEKIINKDTINLGEIVEEAFDKLFRLGRGNFYAKTKH